MHPKEHSLSIYQRVWRFLNRGYFEPVYKTASIVALVLVADLTRWGWVES